MHTPFKQTFHKNPSKENVCMVWSNTHPWNIFSFVIIFHSKVTQQHNCTLQVAGVHKESENWGIPIQRSYHRLWGSFSLSTQGVWHFTCCRFSWVCWGWRGRLWAERCSGVVPWCCSRQPEPRSWCWGWCSPGRSPLCCQTPALCGPRDRSWSRQRPHSERCWLPVHGSEPTVPMSSAQAQSFLPSFLPSWSWGTTATLHFSLLLICTWGNIYQWIKQSD